MDFELCVCIVFFFFFFFFFSCVCVCVCVCVGGFVVPGAPEGSTERLIFVVVFGEVRDRNCDPWFTRRVTYLLHHGGFCSVTWKPINVSC